MAGSEVARTRALIAVATLAAAAAALAMVTIDEPLARWIAAHDTHAAAWDRVIGVLEYPLGIEPWPWTGIAVLVAGVLATVAVPRWGRHARGWQLVATTHLLARNLVLWLKVGTARLRPLEWFARGGDHTFGRAGGVSFPSGHVVLFASILLPLALVVPRTRPLLVLIAFAMVARVAADAHFVSDVLAGLALAAAVTWLCAQAILRTARPPSSPR